jgi:shikimate dehydrogenase
MTFLTGLLGYPLGYSVSPAMHNAAFAALGLDGRYDALPTPPERLAETVAGLRTAGYRGVNVTIPHKQAVMPLLDELSHAARATGAVNTVIVQRFSESLAGRAGTDDLENRPTILRGDNTDWLGFLHPLDAAGCDLAGKTALLLGAGGSARAVVYALLQRGLAHLAIWARNPARAADLAQHAQALSPSLTIHQFTNSPLPIAHSPFTINHSPALIINTTPLGMWPHVDASPWPADLPIPPHALVYDLVYRPERTLFLQQAEAAGCATQGGLEMLVVQGAAAFELWTGQQPPLEVMLAAARAALAAPTP